MRVAIVEWWPRLCGAVAWAAHLQSANSQPCQVDLLTFSKSGRMLLPWQKVPGAWQVHKLEDAVRILNGYDLVILSDIVCRAPEVKKGGDDVPYYVPIVEALTVPWTTMIHDGSYAGKESDTMRAMLRAPSFSGVLLTTRLPEAQARIEKLESGVPIRWVADPYLPYNLSVAQLLPKHYPRRREIIHVGRLSTNKGQDVLLDLARDLDCPINFWGYCAYGMPSQGWLLWELATQHLGLTAVDAPVTTMPQRKNPNMPKFYTGRWSVANRFGRAITYHGAFGTSLSEIDWAPMIAVGLTNEGWKGTLEYATLDAIAMGCVAVVPKQQVEYANYHHVVTMPYERCSFKITQDKTTHETVLKRPTEKWDRPRIVDGLSEMLRYDNDELMSIADGQRGELRRLHSPTRILDLILEAHDLRA